MGSHVPNSQPTAPITGHTPNAASERAAAVRKPAASARRRPSGSTTHKETSDGGSPRTSRTGRIGLVTPRYGADVIGGAEAVVSELAHGLAGRGWDVEILTTCARDHFTWANAYPAGTFREQQLTLRRFPAVVSTSRTERAALERMIISGGSLTIAEQQRWINDDMRVPELFHWLLDHARDYRALVFAPYMFWTTFACAQVAPERTILMPCLHDEPYAYLDLFQPVFSGARGLWFLSEPEHAVAHRIFDLPSSHEVVGSGVHPPPAYDAEGFRRRHSIAGRFVLYAGRREGAKGWEQLLAGFASAVQRYDLPFSLVTIGVGEVRPPAAIADRVIDLGFVPEEERDSAFAAADAYVQPSQYESFSRTIMEAWLAGTLVIANAASEVVAWHCERSGAGLTYDDDVELAECLRFLASAPGAARTLAAKGRPYVLEQYGPDRVLDRVEATIEAWLPVEQGAVRPAQTPSIETAGRDDA
ncbi:MAG TPA: glycosyltransferase family 4 protein [Candidatus Dormibacteraeota bacterium]